VLFEKWNDHEKTKKNLRKESWERTSGKTKLDRLEYVGQVGQGQGGLHIRCDRMGLGQGVLQSRWDRLGQWTGLCPAEPVQLSQSWTRRPWNFHLRLSAKRILIYFQASWKGFGTSWGAVHDELAEWTRSCHGLCSKTWGPPHIEVETLWVSTWQKHNSFENKFDCLEGVSPVIRLGLRNPRKKERK